MDRQLSKNDNILELALLRIFQDEFEFLEFCVFLILRSLINHGVCGSDVIGSRDDIPVISYHSNLRDRLRQDWS